MEKNIGRQFDIKKLWIPFCILFGFAAISLLFGSRAYGAQKDTKKPELSVTANTKSPTNKPVKITVKASDPSGISTVKWAFGAKEASYFKNKGTKISLKKGAASITAAKNGTYTFYAKDKALNTTVKKIVIKNIDKTTPDLKVSLSNTKPTNKSIKMVIEAADASGIASVQYLTGKKEAKDFDSTAKSVPLKSNQGSVTVKKNNKFTIMAKDKAGNATVQSISVSNIDTAAPAMKPSYEVMNQKATVQLNTKDSQSGISQTKYLRGKVTDVNSSKWDNAVIIDNNKSFVTNKAGTYSILSVDKAGNKTADNISVELEKRAVWISYLEFQTFQSYLKKYNLSLNETNFTEYFEEVFDQCIENKMNTVIVQVRPFGDALYKSKYFPWSDCLSSSQGVNPGFDPLEILVDLAHDRGLKIEAWVNPYRVASSTSKALSSDNQAKKWMNSSNASQKRNVLTQGGIIYYNPAKTEVQTLIINGVKEIVQNYDVDGIHFDDYFYPALGSKYKTIFDATEYKSYVAGCKKNGTTPKSIVEWRRNNVNTLVKKIYSSIKAIDKNVVFGISPQGNISNLYLNDKNYVDVKTWLKSSGYVDYICPQIYWSFDNKQNAAFDKMVEEWLEIRTSPSVNVYIGLAAYRAGIKKTSSVAKNDPGWANHSEELKEQVEYIRDTGLVDGFMLFRYENIISPQASKEMKNLLSILD